MNTPRFSLWSPIRIILLMPVGSAIASLGLSSFTAKSTIGTDYSTHSQALIASKPKAGRDTINWLLPKEDIKRHLEPFTYDLRELHNQALDPDVLLSPCFSPTQLSFPGYYDVYSASNHSLPFSIWAGVRSLILGTKQQRVHISIFDSYSPADPKNFQLLLDITTRLKSFSEVYSDYLEMKPLTPPTPNNSYRLTLHNTKHPASPLFARLTYEPNPNIENRWQVVLYIYSLPQGLGR